MNQQKLPPWLKAEEIGFVDPWAKELDFIKEQIKVALRFGKNYIVYKEDPCLLQNTKKVESLMEQGIDLHPFATFIYRFTLFDPTEEEK